MKNKALFFMCLTISFLSTQTLTRNLPAKAVCIAPVANLFNEYLGLKFTQATDETIRDIYLNIPASGQGNPPLMRISQCLLHEVVTVTEQRGCEYHVMVHDRFYRNKEEHAPWSTFAAHKDDFIFLDEVTFFDEVDLKNPYTFLPIPYDWQDQSSYESTGKIFTLTCSHKDETTGYTFSGGTRFAIHSKNESTVTVYVLCGNKINIIVLPLLSGRINTNRSREEKQTCILEEYAKAAGANASKNPLVTAFGGRSTDYFPPQDYTTVASILPDGQINRGYDRPTKDRVQRGMTMPELAAFINLVCGVTPFPFANSTTFNRDQPNLAPDKPVQEGGFVTGPGYMGCIVSLAENRIADIRSYDHHDGCARWATLTETFKGIHTYNDLLEAYRTNQPLELLNKAGDKVIATFKPGSWHIKPLITEYNEAFWQAYNKWSN